MPHESRISLPCDIAFLVGEHLSAADLATLLRLNRTFAQLLTPLLNRRALHRCHCKMALQYAAATGNRNLVHLIVTSAKNLLARNDDPDQTIIFFAPMRRRAAEAVDQILLQGRRVIVQDTFSFRTPLHDAARSNNYDLLAALLSLGAATVARDFEGLTVLHYAVARTDIPAAALLLHHGADPNALDIHAQSPLHHAALLANIALTALLLLSGADPSLRCTTNHTAIEKTPTRNTALDILLLAHSTTSFRSSTHQTALHMAACLGSLPLLLHLLHNTHIPVNARDSFGSTALHEAAAAGWCAAAAALLLRGADPDAQDAHGCTPLHRARGWGVAAEILAFAPVLGVRNRRGAGAMDHLALRMRVGRGGGCVRDLLRGWVPRRMRGGEVLAG